MADSEKKPSRSGRKISRCGGADKTASTTGTTGEFHLGTIRRLTELMNEYGLVEVEMARGDDYIHVRRAGAETPMMAAPMMATTPIAAAQTVAEVTPAKPRRTINSPMVGAFYRASDPKAKPFVSEGDTVGPETTVCIIEAMKVFNQIPAETSGKIVEILVANGATIEFGQPLFVLE